MDRESAREMLAKRHADTDADTAEAAPARKGSRQQQGAAGTSDGGILGQVMSNPIAKRMLGTAMVAITGTLVRGIMGALKSPKRPL